jgi:hypothetical protein
MRTGTTTKAKLHKLSLTDWILTLCASGRFGVREAIATATRQRNRKQGSSAQRQDQPEDRGT